MATGVCPRAALGLLMLDGERLLILTPFTLTPETIRNDAQGTTSERAVNQPTTKVITAIAVPLAANHVVHEIADLFESRNFQEVGFTLEWIVVFGMGSEVTANKAARICAQYDSVILTQIPKSTVWVSPSASQVVDQLCEELCLSVGDS